MNLEQNKELHAISFDCTIKKLDNILKIKIDLSFHPKFYKNLLLILGSCSLIFFVFLSIGEIFQGVLFIAFLFIIFLPLVILYIYFKYQRREWLFDKSTHIIRYQKIINSLKYIKEFNFYEVKSLIQRGDTRFGCYNISVKLETKKIYKIYVGEKQDIAYLGKIISEFINSPLSYETKIYQE